MEKPADSRKFSNIKPANEPLSVYEPESTRFANEFDEVVQRIEINADLLHRRLNCILKEPVPTPVAVFSFEPESEYFGKLAEVLIKLNDVSDSLARLHSRVVF